MKYGRTQDGEVDRQGFGEPLQRAMLCQGRHDFMFFKFLRMLATLVTVH